MARFESASELITTAAVEVGLPPVQSPFSSTDPIYQQLIKLLNVCGRELALMPSWNMQFREGTLTVVAGQTEYDLPTDFLSVVDSTMYDNASGFYGRNVTPQGWVAWTKEEPSLLWPVVFRVARRKIIIPDSVPAGTVLSYEYRSRAWVVSGTSQDVYKDKVDAGGDVVLFEPVLMTRMLVFKFLRAKGFESSGAFAEFTTVLDMVKSSDRPAATHDLSCTPFGRKLLGIDNVPDTGFGS